MDVYLLWVLCCVSRGLCVGLITHTEESYRLWCERVFREASIMRRPWPTRGCCTMVKNKKHTTGRCYLRLQLILITRGCKQISLSPSSYSNLMLWRHISLFSLTYCGAKESSHLKIQKDETVCWRKLWIQLGEQVQCAASSTEIKDCASNSIWHSVRHFQICSKYSGHRGASKLAGGGGRGREGRLPCCGFTKAPKTEV